MKKFEEEVKRPSNAGIDPFSKRDVSFEKLSSKFTKGAQTLKEWKEYAFKAEDKIRELESQLKKQQPEIPEVPQFVADWYEENKGSLDYMIFETCRDLTDESTDEFENWFGYDENKAITTLVHMKNGYTVKEKRFYLKNKLTGQRLIRLLEENGGGFLECVTSIDKERMQFTQSEIDSMAAESYEQIEVVE
ncbi:DUF1642 domain-containing protein [Lactococcus petauri]|uniref:DUF1642 domain-containing protein n=1 Tax=Lactococcus petauri TaxID=1940789 RepID=UPI0038546FC8